MQASSLLAGSGDLNDSLADLKDSKARRRTMSDCQIRTFDVTDQRVIEQFEAVPRERFLPASLRDLAYSDMGLILPPGETGGEARYLLPPLVLARLLQSGRIEQSDKVLDLAGGMGYSAALLAGLSGHVVALEANAVLRGQIEHRTTGWSHVSAFAGSLEQGAAAQAPFDVILVNGAVETGLDPLFSQLAPGGRLLTILRSANDPTGRAAKAMLYEKTGADVCGRILFDASAPVLAPFRKAPAFVF